MNEIYLDHAASTPMTSSVLEAMLPYMTEVYGNPSSIHGFGRRMHQALEKSRRGIAKNLGARPEEIYFVSGGTEANNWALDGIMKSYGQVGDHLIVSSIEHPAVLNKAKALEEEGYQVTYIEPNQEGVVSLERIKEARQENTRLISVMMVNNETGVRQPIEAIGAYARAEGIISHTDGVQALSHHKVDLADLQVDLMSFSGHKLNGPVGIGGLFIRSGTKIKNLLCGGAQERSRRAGTSLTALAVGLGVALEERVSQVEAYYKMLKDKKDYFFKGLKEKGLDCQVNGAYEDSHPGIINLQFKGIKGEALVMNLDLAGIAVSSGSACASGALSASHVLLAMGLTSQEAKSSIRFSFGQGTSYEDLDQVIETLSSVIARLRG